MTDKPRNERDAEFLARHRRLGAEDDRPARGTAERIQVFGQVRGESKAAWRFFDGTKEVWLPKSQVKIAEVRAGTSAAEVDLPEWLAKEKGLI